MDTSLPVLKATRECKAAILGGNTAACLTTGLIKQKDLTPPPDCIKQTPAGFPTTTTVRNEEKWGEILTFGVLGLRFVPRRLRGEFGPNAGGRRVQLPPRGGFFGERGGPQLHGHQVVVLRSQD